MGLTKSQMSAREWLHAFVTQGKGTVLRITVRHTLTHAVSLNALKIFYRLLDVERCRVIEKLEHANCKAGAYVQHT